MYLEVTSLTKLVLALLGLVLIASTLVWQVVVSEKNKFSSPRDYLAGKYVEALKLQAFIGDEHHDSLQKILRVLSQALTSIEDIEEQEARRIMNSEKVRSALRQLDKVKKM